MRLAHLARQSRVTAGGDALISPKSVRHSDIGCFFMNRVKCRIAKHVRADTIHVPFLGR